MGSLGDRIKAYEKVSSPHLLKRVPVMIRVDGRAFHTFTRGLNKPYDDRFITAMIIAARETAKEMQGFKACYVQSDEATFCITDYDTNETEGWFGYDLSKIVSITAALMSVNFKHYFGTNKLPIFDSRAFNVPQNDVVNAFLWRAQDWERNSLHMYASSFFSHKELHKKNRSDKHEMLHRIGKNWVKDNFNHHVNGTFIINSVLETRVYTNIKPTYEDINKDIGELFIGE